jgi:phosphatidylserine/phosphatidylglycerophosphate/cardiolipin synthase-like enzyme
VKLLIQPESGIDPLLEALRKAKKSIQILIFRIDRSEVEKALVDAAQRGVTVQALIASTNRGGDKNLRRFEMRLLERGITVTRTSDDLVRYHGKMFIVDGKELYLLAFNLTHMDISLSRSFALVISKPSLVKEACKLFECDVKRIPYKAEEDDFVVSPANAREQLTKFIQGAKKQLLMYEMKISDRDIIKILNEKISDGVDVRIIGRSAVSKSIAGATLPKRTLPMRLHVRAILRDGKSAFLGSQSLRKLELEARREIGVIVHDASVVKQMIHVFDKDWQTAEPTVAAPQDAILMSMDMSAKKVAKSVAKQISVRPVVEQLLDKVMDSKGDSAYEPDALAQTVREAFRDEIQEAVTHTLHDMATVAAEAEPAKSDPVKSSKKVA